MPQKHPVTTSWLIEGWDGVSHLSTRVYMRRMLGVHTMPDSACNDAASLLPPAGAGAASAAARRCAGASPAL